MTDAIIQHVVISTLFAALVASIVWIRKADPAGFRYYLWLVAALKFAIPTAVFTAFGTWVHHLVPTHIIPIFLYPSGSQAFSRLTEAWPQAGRNVSWLPIGLSGVWFLGAVGFLLIWIVRFRSQRPPSDEAPICLVDIVSKLSRHMGLRRRVTVRSVMTGGDLAQYGIFKSAILVPRSVCNSLNREELEAILAHELMHVRRWDNLAAVVVHLLTCIFWFHPALWWIERRLIVERELACDEAVIDRGWSAGSYATGILKFCQFHFVGLQAGASGFSGSSLHERMERIMSYKPIAHRKRAGIILALGVVLMLAPATVGFMSGRPVYAQSREEAQQHGATCVFANKHYPEGAIIHQDGGHEQLCVVAFRRPIWVRTSPEIRQRGQSVAELPAPVQQTVFCTPKRSNSKNSCTCEEGGLYSSGSIVDSRHGQLSCAAGRWNALSGSKK